MTAYALIGGVLLVFLVIVWLAFRYSEGKGRAEAERDRHREMSEQARKANEIDEAIASLSDRDLDSELHDR